MATGPEHYLLAQNALLTALTDGIPTTDATRMQLDGIGHALLALAAAVGTYGESDATRTINDVRVWERVAGEYTAQQRRDAAERAAERKCPCGCSGGPDDCTCGMRCECSNCVYCDLIVRDAESPADRPTLAEQLRAVGAEQAALDAEADAAAAERRAREVEHFAAIEAADVLQMEHEMAVEAGMECDPETCAYCGGA